MLQSLSIPPHTQSLSFALNSSSNPTSLHYPRRSSSVPCRASTVGDFSRCMVASRNPTAASLYEVLKVKQNASPADIKKAYRSLAKIYHPDTADSSPDGGDFIQIYNAYETLSDPKARAVYDISIGLVGRRMVARSTGSTSSFGGYSSSPSTIDRRPGFYSTRRWESDQCW